MIPWLIAAIVIFDLVVVFAGIGLAIRYMWQPFHDAFPPRAIADDAVRRDFQSFRIGPLNLGHSVHVAADEDFLHLLPARILRWCNARPLSVPWSEVVVTKRLRSGRWVEAALGGRKIVGPAWCLELAEASGG